MKFWHSLVSAFTLAAAIVIAGATFDNAWAPLSNPPFFPFFGNGAPIGTPTGQLYFDTSVTPYQGYVFNFGNQSWNKFGYAGGSSAVTTTGTPANGNLARFSSSISITNGDLSGDCTTNLTLVVTCTKTNGVAFGTFATANAAAPPIIGNTTPNSATFTTLNVNTAFNATGLVTNADLANSSVTIAGNAVSLGGSLTSTTLTAALNLATSTLQGLVPASGGGTTNFLRADFTWNAPPATSPCTLTAQALQFNNAGAFGCAAITDNGSLLSTSERLTVNPANNGQGFVVTGSSLTGSSALNLINFSETWNTTGNPNAIQLAITNTASGTLAKLLNLLAGAAGSTLEFSVDTSGNTFANGSSKTAALFATGSAPTLTGTCTTGTQHGGNTAGDFLATCAAQTVIFAFATTATTGWYCDAHDMTTTVDTLNETSSDTTHCTLTGTTAANDKIVFHAVAY